MSPRSWLVLGALLGGLGVIIGALGAHGLKDKLVELGREADYETAVRYQMYHAIALVAVGLLGAQGRTVSLQVAGWCFLLGVLIFSGLLYALIFTGQRWLGAIVPIGGTLMIVGWFSLAFAGWKLLAEK